MTADDPGRDTRHERAPRAAHKGQDPDRDDEADDEERARSDRGSGAHRFEDCHGDAVEGKAVVEVQEPGFVDFSSVVCPHTGMTAREAAIKAVVARDDLGAETTVPPEAPLEERCTALIEDVRVFTGVLAAELHGGLASTGPFDAARQALLAHQATMWSDSFALYTALAVLALDDEEGPAGAGSPG